MLYKIVNVQLSHPSFSWGNGLYAIINTTDTELNMCQLDKNNKPTLYEDGRFMITATGINNKEVYATKLYLEH